MAKLKLYLDVDDVILGELAGTVWPTVRATRVTQSKQGLQFRYNVAYSPECIDALRRFTNGHDCELVWLTTWCDDLRVIRKLVPKIGWGRRCRVAPYAANEHTADDVEWTAWKGDFVIADYDEGVPFIWADDSAVIHHLERVEASLPGAEFLALAPAAKIGLTPKHVASMHEFARSVTGVTCDDCEPGDA